MSIGLAYVRCRGVCPEVGAAAISNSRAARVRWIMGERCSRYETNINPAQNLEAFRTGCCARYKMCCAATHEDTHAFIPALNSARSASTRVRLTASCAESRDTLADGGRI